MLHARLFQEAPRYRDEHFQPTRSSLASKESTDEPQYLDGNADFDRPLFVQFCTNKPEEFLAAAEYVAPYCDAVDLNLGCPQGIARSGHYGAFLQEDWDTIFKLINTLHNSLSVPITAKMRILDTKERSLEYAKMILSAGASILTVHGRKREQKGHNTGTADWSILRYLRANLPPDTVLFANGNVLNYEDIQTCLDATGFDGVMSAEGNLSDPTIFAEPPSDPNDREYWRSPDGAGGYRVDGVVRRYLDIMYRYVLEQDPPHRSPLYIPGDDTPEPALPELSSTKQPKSKKRKRDNPLLSSPNMRPLQGHLFHMLRSVVSLHTDIRDALARTNVGDMEGFERVLVMLERAVRKALDDDASKTPEQRTADEAAEEASLTPSIRALKKYRRPWWVCQPYIRPSPEEALEKGALQLKKKEIEKLTQKGGKEKRLKGDDLTGTERSIDPGVVREQTAQVVDEVNQIPTAAVVCG